MKNGWSIKRLGEVATVIAGQSPDGSFYNTSGDGLPFYQGKKEFGERYIGDPTTWTTQVTRVAQEGDVLMSVRAPVGPVNFAIGESCIGRGLAAIRVNGHLDRNFLFYFLLSKQDEIAGTEGAVFASINKSQIEKIEIAAPPLPEQRRIVGILDEAFASIAAAKANAEKSLQNARELFESERNALFTRTSRDCQAASLGDIAEFKNGLNFNQSSRGQSVRLVGVSAFGNNYIVPMQELETVTIDGSLDESYQLRENDILTVRSNGSKDLVGRCMLVPSVDDPISYSGFVIRIRCVPKVIVPRFLLHFMKSSVTRDRLTRDGGGTNISNINQAKLSALPLPRPPLKNQQAVADKLDRLLEESNRMETLYRRKFDAVNTLKKSILHHAFSGKL